MRVGLIGIWVSVALVACSSDDEAQLSLPREPIAAGAWFPLNVADSCSGGGKINFCSSESVTSVDAIVVTHPRVADVVHMDELEEGLRYEHAELVIVAKEPGGTAIKVDSTFDDGSQRQVETKIEVRKADRLEVSHGCAVQDADDRRLLPVDHELRLELELLAGEQSLVGEHRRELLAGDGLERQPGNLQRNPYRWRTPSHGGTAELSSPLFPKFSASFDVYERDEVELTSVERRYPGTVSFNQNVLFEATLSVRGKRPCAFPPLRIETATPEVCIGPDGVESWLVESPQSAFGVRALEAGTCALTVAVDGTETRLAVEHELEIDAETLPEPNPCEDVVCNEPAECPANTELALRECCATCVPVPDAERCEEQRAVWDPLYEAELPKANQCDKDEDCSSVVLIAGCRRYCQVPLNTAAIVDFMAAISEDYYTSCPSCMVDQQVGCTGVDGRAHCDAGLCKMGP